MSKAERLNTDCYEDRHSFFGGIITLLDINKLEEDDWIITIKHEPGWLAKLFGCKPSTVQYRGDCTMWSKYPTGEIANSLLESWFYEIWQAEIWKEENEFCYIVKEYKSRPRWVVMNRGRPISPRFVSHQEANEWAKEHNHHIRWWEPAVTEENG